MKRKDAEVAVREMDGFDWGGYSLRVGWSKAVPVGPKAAYGDWTRDHISTVAHPSTAVERSRSRSHSRNRRRYSRSRSRDRYHSRSRSQERPYHSRRHQSRSWSRSRSPRHRRRSRSPYGRHSGHVDSEAQSFIRTVANKVREHGQQFEDVLRDRENGKPKFAFLWDEKVSTDMQIQAEELMFDNYDGRVLNVAFIIRYCSLVDASMRVSLMR
jgi:U2-associated protein SR140